MTLANPVSLLLEVNRILAAAQIRFATYGGLALALYGVPRFTQDADIALAGTKRSKPNQRPHVAL